MSRYVQLFKVGQWRLDVWFSCAHWEWKPTRWEAWGGALVYYSWLCFELCRDIRPDILGDWTLGGPLDKEKSC